MNVVVAGFCWYNIIRPALVRDFNGRVEGLTRRSDGRIAPGSGFRVVLRR